MNLTNFISRLLSNIDTNPLSPTYACADKAYWWYKTKDFPNARLQEYLLSFAWLGTHRHQKNPFYGNKQLILLAKESLSFLVKIQNKDGSFSEWYPKEASFVATAFSMAKAADACMQLNVHDKQVNSMFSRAADWLMHAQEGVSNQAAGAAYALLAISQAAREESYEQAARKMMKILLSRQTGEGWFPEYGGADIGYHQVLLDFLARYHLMTQDKQCLDAARKACFFLQHFIHPDGSCGGVYGSRGTAFTFPFGTAYFSSYLPEAADINARINHYNPEWMDDAFALCYHDSHVLADFLAHNAKKKSAPAGLHIFDQAGLLSCNKNYYFAAALRKGGAFVLYSNKGPLLSSDAGLWIKKGRNLLTTQWSNTSVFLKDGKTIIIKGRFIEIPRQTLTLAKNLALRFSLLFLPNKGRAYLKETARKKLILSPRATSKTYERRITLREDSVEIEDTVNFPGETVSLRHHPAQYVPTAQFYTPDYLAPPSNELHWTSDGERGKAKRVFRCT